MWSQEEKIIIFLNSFSILCVLGLLSIFCCLILMTILTKLITQLLLHINRQIKYYQESKETREDIKCEEGSKKISLKQLSQIKNRLRQVYPHDYFFVFRQPGIVISTGQALISDVGGISAWTLQRSKADLENSQIDTQDQEIDEKVKNEQFKIFINWIVERTKSVKNQEERAKILFEKVVERYETLELTIMVTSQRWIGAWNSISDYLFKKKKHGHNIAFILS